MVVYACIRNKFGATEKETTTSTEASQQVKTSALDQESMFKEQLPGDRKMHKCMGTGKCTYACDVGVISY